MVTIRSAHFRSIKAFSLLEMSVVLVLISLVAGGGLVVFTASIQQSQYDGTVATMQALDKVLYNYRLANNFLPCPGDMRIAPGATGYGMAAGNPNFSQCSGGPVLANFATSTWAEGAVPTRALGLPDSYMYDGWGNHIRYGVDVTMTGSSAWVNGSGFSTGPFTTTPVDALCGPITVCDSGGYTGTYPTGHCTNTARTTAATYALISNGANGFGAFTQNGVLSNNISSNINEQVNCHYTGSACPATSASAYPVYVQQLPAYQSITYAGNALYYFDDIVTFKERWQLQAPLEPNITTLYILEQPGSPGGTIAFGIQEDTVPGSGILGVPGSENPAGYNLAADPYGNLWGGEQDPNSGAYYVYKISCGSEVWNSESMGFSGAALGQFSDYPSIAFDKNGNLWTSAPGTSSNAPVQEFNPLNTTHTFIQSIGGVGTTAGYTNGTFNNVAGIPHGIAFDPYGNLWVADSGNNRVQEFSISGSTSSWVQTIPAGCLNTSSPACPASFLDGHFSSPQGVAFDPSGNLWVTDNVNNRVQEFSINSSTYSWVQTIPAGCSNTSFPACSSGPYNGPQVITVDPGTGNVWVAGATNGIVEVTSAGAVVTPTISMAGGGVLTGLGIVTSYR